MPELILTPGGRLRVSTGAPEGDAAPPASASLREVFRAFDLHPAAGLVALAAARRYSNILLGAVNSGVGRAFHLTPRFHLA